MASTDFHINGPTVIEFKNAGAGGSYTSLGYTDNDDLIRISSVDHKRTYTRNNSGDMIAEAVLNGTTATLDFTLVSWDEVALATLIARCRTGTGTALADSGKIATIGRSALLNGVEIKITPTNTGADVYVFPRLMLQSGPEIIDLGNAVKRVSLSFVTYAETSPTASSTYVTISSLGS